jgi:hypothetical protein
MACEFLTGDGVVYCVWGRPKIKDMNDLVMHLEAAVEAAGRPAVYITRVPVDAPAPDAKVRQYLNSLMPRITALCSTYHVVLEGAGFIAALKRGVLVSLFQIGNKRGMFFVHADVDEVVRSIQAERQLAVRALLIRADSRGLLRGRTPESISPRSKRRRDLPSTSGVRSNQEEASRVAGSNLR